MKNNYSDPELMVTTFSNMSVVGVSSVVPGVPVSPEEPDKIPEGPGLDGNKLDPDFWE